MSYKELSKEELQSTLAALKEEYNEICKMNVNLDMSRGKPGADQLDLSMGLLDVFHGASDLKSENGFDCRNYGLLDGLPEGKRMMADIMGV